MKKKLIIILPILIAVFAFIGVYRYYNKEDKTTTLTVVEKRWIEENKDTVFDVEVINNYPLYGMNGEGVFFSFLDDMTKNINLEFNKIPYLKESTPTTNSYRIRIIDESEFDSKKDLELFTDSYVAIGKTYQRINYIKDMKNLTFGVFTSDSENISYYLKSGTNLSFKTYENIDSLYKALDNDEVNMIIVPNIMYLDRTINTAYSINYYFPEMVKKIVFTLSDGNEELNTIVRKYYTKWKATKYVKEYNDAYLDYYLEQNNVSAKSRASLISKTYVYGYVKNNPYEVLSNNNVKGIAGEYVNRLFRLTDIEFKYKEYASKKELKNAIERGEIDIYFDYYNYSDDKYLPTLSTFVEEYVVLGKSKDSYIVNSFESLKDKNIVMLKDDSLYNYFFNNSRSKIETVDDVDSFNKNIDDYLVVVDREVYNAYKNSIFKEYDLLYMDAMMNDYKFMVLSKDKDFYNLFNYIINTNSYYNYRNAGIQSLHASLFEDATLEYIYIAVLLIIFLPIILLALLFIHLKRKRRKKRVTKIDRHKYTDMLTSLKNRNYLNAKMPEWEECKVYPQSVVIVDLNRVKYVNDNYGHEAGDNLIIKASSILVNTQLENSEIIRTDGNEFLIYLVGYSEKQVDIYTKKLFKELKELPYDYGAGVGYSIIEDNIKSLDDAINEATLDMIASKEEFKK